MFLQRFVFMSILFNYLILNPLQFDQVEIINVWFINVNV